MGELGFGFGVCAVLGFAYWLGVAVTKDDIVADCKKIGAFHISGHVYECKPQQKAST